MSVTNQQVITLLENVLFETATQAAANAGTWINNSAASSVSSLAAAMANSGEAKIAATVVGYYLASLGRAPNAAEVQYYVGIAEQGLSQAQIAAGQVASTTWDTIGKYFAHSPEFATRGNIDFSLGNTAAYLEAVPWLYQSVLGRAASSAELAYYDNQVINGTDLGTLFREFTASPEFHTDTDTQIAAALASFGTSTVAGTQPSAVAVSVTLGAPPPPTSTPSPAPTPTPSFGTLTTGNDTINDASMTGAHTYNAILGAGATLNAGDSLTGNGLATLAITDVAVGATDHLPGTLLAGIETITLTTAGNAGLNAGSTFDAHAVTGLTTLTVNASDNLGDFIIATNNVAVSITTLSATVNVKDFASLDITDNHLTTLDLTRGSGLNGNVTIHDPTGPTSLTVNVDNLNSATGLITDASNHITTVTIAGSSTLSNIDGFVDTSLTSLTLTGNVTLGTPVSHYVGNSSLATLDLSADTNTGGPNFIDIHSAAAVSLGDTNNTLVDDGSGLTGAGGSILVGDGDNDITDNSTNGATSIQLGNGTNTITDNSGNIHSSITVGDGTNTVVANSLGGGTFSFGTGAGNSLDLQNTTGSTISVNPEATLSTSAVSLAISNAAHGNDLVFTTSLGSTSPDNTANLAQLISDAVVNGAGGVAYGTLNGSGDLYIAVSAAGTGGNNDITVVELVGGASLEPGITVSGTHLTF